MSELNFTGNALRGSRAIVSFDAGFDATPAMALVKEMLRATFSVPKGVRGSKPFVDRVVAFTLADGKVWCRHYQICTSSSTTSSTTEKVGEGDEGKTGKGRKGEGEEMELVEIGPRFVMTPIVVLEGSFGGPVVYENKEFVSPNAVRREVRERRAVKKGGREVQKIKKGVKRREMEKEVAVRREGEIDDAVLFA
jgi:ribosome biogenesis protein BRX1